jgi:two-component system LytT family response regulator
MLINVVIIDDEELAIHALKQELAMHFPEISVVGEGQTIEDGISIINATKPDIVFLDIQIEDDLGFEILEKVNEVNFKVIFTTAYSEYAIRAIKYSALDYLLKPIDKDELKVSLTKLQKENIHVEQLKIQLEELKYKLSGQESSVELIFKNGSKIYKVSPADIFYIEAYGNYSKIWLENSWIISDENLRYHEELLKAYNCVRISRSLLVNFNHTTSFDFVNRFAILKNGEKVLIANRRLTEIKRLVKGL